MSTAGFWVMYQHKCSLLSLKAVNCSQETLSHLFSPPSCETSCRRKCQARCPCQNGGICKGKGICACPPGWTVYFEAFCYSCRLPGFKLARVSCSSWLRILEKQSLFCNTDILKVCTCMTCTCCSDCEPIWQHIIFSVSAEADGILVHIFAITHLYPFVFFVFLCA